MSERVPPNDLEAERAVLGGILLENAALDIVAEALLTPKDFYSDANSKIYGAMVELHAGGVPVDGVTLRDRLEVVGKLVSVGGDDYLLALTDTIPTIKHIAAHAKIVHDKALVRGVITACHEVAARGYGDYGDVDNFLDGAESAMAKAGEGRAIGGDLHHVRDIVEGVYEDVKVRTEGKSGSIGVPTGFPDLDRYTSGMEPALLYIIAGRPGMGKAQPITSTILTPAGFRMMGDLEVGDHVIGSDGAPTRVIGVYDQGELPVYRVRFSDGASTRCCDEHLWETRTRSERRRGLPASVRTLSEIRETLQRGDGPGRNHSVRYMKPAHFSPQPTTAIGPWALGLYLGDGHDGSSVRLSNTEPDMRARFAAAIDLGDEVVSENHVTVRIRRRKRGGQSEFKKGLVSLGLDGLVSHEKFIPKQHLYARVEDRVELLRGLMDSDGHVADSGTSVEYCTASPQLCHDVEFLAGSLGGRVTWVKRATHYTIEGVRTRARDSYRMTISFPSGDIVPVSSEKHLKKWKPGAHRVTERFIKSVEPDGFERCRCIRVDSADSLYVTDDFICTHNTAFALNIIRNVAETKGLPALFFSLEMPRVQLGARLLSSEALVDGGKLREARLTREDWPRLAQSVATISALPIFVDDTPGHDVDDICRVARRKCREDGLSVVCIDYIQLVCSKGRRHDNREQEISYISRTLKGLAKELQIPVIALSQLNRGLESRGDKRPVISDLRESGAIEQDADTILFIYRDEVYSPDTTDRGLAEIIIGKQRQGPTGTVKMLFRKEYVKFESFDGHHEDSQQTFDDPTQERYQ